MQSNSYSGTMIRDLGSMVEKSLTKHSNETLCENCYQPHAQHSEFGSWCPESWPEPMGQRKFSPLFCDFVDPRSREGSGDHCHSAGVVIVGESVRCLRHSEVRQ
jgi:hypothetical protein